MAKAFTWLQFRKIFSSSLNLSGSNTEKSCKYLKLPNLNPQEHTYVWMAAKLSPKIGFNHNISALWGNIYLEI